MREILLPADSPLSRPVERGFNFWLTKLGQFGGDYVNAEMVKAFVNSTGYERRFGG